MASLIRCLLLLASTLSVAAQQPIARAQPKLVVGIIVDQFRYDYLTRFEPELDGGIRRLLNEGAVFTNANYDAVPTVTAVGHSTYLSGATPSVSGIVDNVWYDRETGTQVESITDVSETILGGGGRGASPRRLLVSTIADELKLSGKGGKVVSVSLKNRSAILPAGHMPDGAYWFDGQGHFVSSTYYFDALPNWVETFNATDPAAQCAGLEWAGRTLAAEVGPALYRSVDASPCGDLLVHQMALAALDAEDLGSGEDIDMLLVSYSSVDYVGHQMGPDAPEIREMVSRVDQLIGELLDTIVEKTGGEEVLVVFSADHGVAPLPEVNQQRNMPGGRIDSRQMRAAVAEAVTARFGEGDFLASVGGTGVFFNEETLAANPDVDRSELEQVVAGVLRAQPHIARVYTRTQMMNLSPSDPIDQRVRNGFHPARSPDITYIMDPYYLAGGNGSNHGTPYTYDTHVPVIFWDSSDKIPQGNFARPIGVQDIAPTLATLLGIQTPSGSIGVPIEELLP